MNWRYLLYLWQMNRPLPLLIVLLMLFSGAGWSFVHHGYAPRVRALEWRYEQQQQHTEQKQRIAARQAGPWVKFQRNGKDLQTLWKAIPPSAEFSGLIEELYGLAGDAGLDIAQVTYDPKPLKETALLHYQLGFSISGEYRQIKMFIYTLEQSPRILSIDEIALNGQQSEEKEAVRLNIRISTYFRRGAL